MINRLGLRQLRAFHAVMMTGSVTAAAERLNLTQPAVSKQLSALEEAVGLRLFHRRSGRATAPTQEGIDFFRAVEPTMVGLEEIGTVARAVARREQVHLRIAATPPLINSTPVMEAVRRFTEAEPGARLSLEPRHRLDIEDWVAARRIDLALALLPINHPSLQSIPLVETEAVAVMRPDHPLATAPAVSPEMLGDQAVILLSRQPLRLRIDAVLEQKQQTLEPQFEASSAITVVRMASSGLGVGICDPFSRTAFGSDLVQRPWRPRVPLVYGALVNLAHEMTPHTQTLLGMLMDAFTAQEG